MSDEFNSDDSEVSLYTIEDITTDKDRIDFKIDLPKIPPYDPNVATADITPRASGTMTFGDGGSGKISMLCNWSATQDTANNSSTVTATLTVKASLQGNCLSGSHLTIDGNKKTFSQYLNHPSGAPTITLCTHTVTVYHDSNGNRSLQISAAFVWNGYGWISSSVGGVNFNTLSGSAWATLDRIMLAPPAPSLSTNPSGYYEANEGTTISWGISSDERVTEYEIEYQTWNHITGAYTQWFVIAYLKDKNIRQFTIGHERAYNTGIRFRMRAKNDYLYSGYSETTDWVYHSGIRIFDGTNWRYGKVKVWNGSYWSQGYVAVLQNGYWQ